MGWLRRLLGTETRDVPDAAGELYGSGQLGTVPVYAGYFGAAVSAAKSAGVEAAAGMLSRTFAAARLDGAPWAVAALSPRVRALVGRALVTTGEQLLIVTVATDGQVGLLPARGTVWGGAEESSWLYWAAPDAPSSGGAYRRYPREAVIHAMYTPDPDQPWCGTSPAGSLDARLHTLIGAMLGREASAPHGQLMALVPPRTQAGQSWTPEASTDAKAKAPDALAELSRGGLAIVASSDVATGAQGAVSRVGLSPPSPVAQLYVESFRITAAAFGLPPNLLSTTTYSRDSLRQYEQTTAGPLLREFVAEASARLEVPLTVAGSTTRTPADWVSLARASNSLRQAGLEVTEIRDLLGL